MLAFEHMIRGYVVGPTWGGGEGWKAVSCDLTAAKPFRDQIAALVKDGDFQSCKLGDAVLITRVTITKSAGRVYSRTRTVPLEVCASVQDFVLADWTPEFGEDD